MPVVMVQNNQAGPTVLSSDPKGTEYVEWQGKGDVNGEDIQPVSELIQGTAAYRKAVRRGVLTELDDDAAEMISDAERRQQAAWDVRQNSSAEVAAGAIDQQANNDIITLPCVGPSQSGICGEPVGVKDRTKNERPPLCPRHDGLASQYIPQPDMVNGKPVVNWIRSTMGPRETQA